LGFEDYKKKQTKKGVASLCKIKKKQDRKKEGGI